MLNLPLHATYISYWDEGTVETACVINSDLSLTVDASDNENDLNLGSLLNEEVVLSFNNQDYTLEAEDGELTESGKASLLNIEQE